MPDLLNWLILEDDCRAAVLGLEKLMITEKPPAKERYSTLLEENPELLQYANLKHIASFMDYPTVVKLHLVPNWEKEKTNDNFSIYGVGSFVWKIDDILEFNKKFVEQGYENILPTNILIKKIAILSCMDKFADELLPVALGIRTVM